MHAGHNNYICVDIHCFAGEGETIANYIGHAVENFGCLIIMGEYNRISLSFEREDGFNISNEARPQDWRNDTLNTRIKRIEMA
jgi:hypothetical protein